MKRQSRIMTESQENKGFDMKSLAAASTAGSSLLHTDSSVAMEFELEMF